MNLLALRPDFLGADRNRHALEGYRLDDWATLDLTGTARTGLESWDKGDITSRAEIEFRGLTSSEDAPHPGLQVITGQLGGAPK